MDRTPVNSSDIADIGYDDTTMTLEVGFHSGSIYQYFDVPQTAYGEFMSADSKGKYFNMYIKNNYRYSKL